MSEPRPRAFGRAPRWVLALLVLTICALGALPFLVGGSGDYAGTDSQATQTLEDRGAHPWFRSLFEPGSAEVESGLFALQAALGAGLVGYVGGRLHERRKQASRAAARPAAAEDEA